jgi:micrococcal nuclease
MNKRTKRRLMKLAVSLLVAGIGLLLARTSPPPEVLGTVSPGFYRVARFEDGDTITVDMNGKEERVRMIGVDTPETKDPRKPVQCFGRAASEFTKQLIGNQPVRLEADEQSSNRDRYNRLLRHVYLSDGRLVQAEIIRQGYGFAYTSFPFTKSDEFRTLEKEARNSNRGLWGSCQPTENQYGGHTSNPESQ